MSTQQTLDHLVPVLDALSGIAAGVRDAQRGDPTPCTDFDVAALTGHVVGWLESFAAGFASDDGQTPDEDVSAVQVPAEDAAPRIRDAARTLTAAVRAGAAERPLAIGGSAMPGDLALSMILGEYLVHGWDLAVATGQPWTPDDDAADAARRFLTGMITPDTRGPDGWFGHEVPVADDASALERLLGLAGRDPGWAAAPPAARAAGATTARSA